MVKHPDATRPMGVRRVYRPLDEASWNDAARVAIGWFMIIVLAVITGGLLAINELLIINVGDTDLRAMQYDYRIVNEPTNFYHWYFTYGATCCNQDANLPGYGHCNQFPPGQQPPWERYNAPPCPAILYYQCFNLTDPLCNSTRSLVYDSMGLGNDGQYTNCSLGGRLRIGSQEVARSLPTALVIADESGTILEFYAYPIAEISDPAVQAGIQNFIAYAIKTYGSTSYWQPYTVISSALTVNDQPASLRLNYTQYRRATKTIPNWPWTIFDFPGMHKECTNTSTNVTFYLEGLIPSYTANPFDIAYPNTMVSTIRFFNSSARFPMWKIDLGNSTGDTVATNASQLAHVVVRLANSIHIRVSMIAAPGACYAWMIDSDSVQVGYGNPVFSGPVSELANASLVGGPTPLLVLMTDAGGPEPISLPPYAGMWYLMFGFVCAAFFVIPLGFFLLVGIPLIWWNVRSNRGKPPLVYRYMRRYRGW